MPGRSMLRLVRRAFRSRAMPPATTRVVSLVCGLQDCL